MSPKARKERKAAAKGGCNRPVEDCGRCGGSKGDKICDSCNKCKEHGWEIEISKDGKRYKFHLTDSEGVVVKTLHSVVAFLKATTYEAGEWIRAQKQQTNEGGGAAGGGGGGSEKSKDEDAEPSNGGGGVETGSGREGGTDGEDDSTERTSDASSNAGGGATAGGTGGTALAENPEDDDAPFADLERLLEGGAEAYYKSVWEEVLAELKETKENTLGKLEALEDEIGEEEAEFNNRISDKREKLFAQLDGEEKKKAERLDRCIVDCIITQMLDVWKREMAVLTAAQAQLERIFSTITELELDTAERACTRNETSVEQNSIL